MKKNIFILLAFALLLSITGCKKEEKGLDIIDFENGVLNIDNSKIESYVKENGYNDFRFEFDVDKQIYSCEVYMTPEQSANVNIDGEGYESFIASARTFLVNGNNVMADVLKGYNLSGISAGMVLASSENVVYCVAVDGSVNYVAHTKSNAVTSKDLENEISKIANNVLSDKLTVTIDSAKKIVSIFYAGPHNGGREQTQDSVQDTLDVVVEFLDENGFTDYSVYVNSYDGQPMAKKVFLNQDETTDKPDSVEIAGYEKVGTIHASGKPVYKIISSEENAENDVKAFKAAIAALNNEIEYCYYVVDDSGKFIARGVNDTFTPYVFSKTYKPFSEPPFAVPFKYYFFTFFDDIDYSGYTSRDGLVEGGGELFEFVINVEDVGEHDRCQVAAQKIYDAMKLTLGDEYYYRIIVYQNTENEICIETPVE